MRFLFSATQSILTLFLIFSSSIVNASTIEDLLAGDEPNGVVFEVLAPNMEAWYRIRPKLLKDVERLKEKFPDLDIAVVSHGNEQFALMSENTNRFPELHQAVQVLGKNGVDVHVCATFASWKNIMPEAFPDYIDVAGSGPAQINNYRSLGYVLIEKYAF